MRRLFYSILVLLLFFQVGVLSAAEPLPKLPEDSSIAKGTLPNGVSYMLVTNKSVKGVADIAILQRACQTSIDVPEGLLARMGVGPGREGYSRSFEGNMLYSFRDCPFVVGDSCVDSLLFASMKIIGEASALGDPAYGTTNQTLIIAGDIDKASLQSKLKMLSMWVPLHTGVKSQPEYVWEPSDAPVFEVSENGPASTIRFEYKVPASPIADNSTVVAVMAKQFHFILKTVVTTAIGHALCAEGIPYSDIDCVAICSDVHLGDDVFSVSLTVAPEDVSAATEIAASVLKKIAHEDITVDEYAWAYRKMSYDDWARAHVPMGNAAYVTKCVNSVLYNASLATKKSEVEFYRSRVLEQDVRTTLFNKFTTGLAEDGNLRVSVSGAPLGLTADSLAALVLNAERPVSFIDVNISDTLGFAAPQDKKSSIPSAKKDALTGGNTWTYSNGVNVLYKNMPTDGIIYFSWVLRGGEEVAPTLVEKSISQFHGEDFINLLNANGITMDIVAHSQDICITGRAASERLQLLLRAFQMVFEAMPELGSPKGGQLIMVGDRTLYSVQKAFQSYTLGFNSLHAARQKKTVEKPLAIDKEDESVVYQTLLSGDYLYSSENYMVAAVAGEVLEDALIAALSGTGYYATVQGRFLVSPRDMYSTLVTVRKVDGAQQTLSAAALRNLVRSTLSDLSKHPYQQSKIVAAKKIVTGGFAKAQETPKYWLDIARIRFAESKDLATKYSDKVNLVTADKVRELFAAITESGTIEHTSAQ